MTLFSLITLSIHIVAVWGSEHLAVGVVLGLGGVSRSQCVEEIPAVPGHRQTVLTSLIADGERRVFSRVPQTRQTLDLYITRHI